MDMSLSKLRELMMDRKPGVLQSMGSQRVGRNWATELNWKWTGNWYLRAFPLESMELGFCANTLESRGGERWIFKHLWFSPRDMGTAGPKNPPLKFTSICFSKYWEKNSRRCRRESLILKSKNKFCFVSFTSLFACCTTRHLGSSSLTRDWTDAPAVEAQSLNQRTTKPLDHQESSWKSC